MTKKMVIPQLKGSGWYKTDNFSRADKVTDKASNKDLGIDDIQLRAIDEGYEGEADVTIRFDNGLAVYGRIYKSKNGQDLILNFREHKTRNEAGAVTSSYVYNVKVPLEIQAQVLRHAETFFVDVEDAPAGGISDAEVAETVEQTPAPKAKAPAKPSVAELRKRAMEMSEEELNALFPAKA